MCDINDPFDQSHSLASSNHYAHLKLVLLCQILKSGPHVDGRKDWQTTCAIIVITTDRSWLSVGLVNQLYRATALFLSWIDSSYFFLCSQRDDLCHGTWQALLSITHGGSLTRSQTILPAVYRQEEVYAMCMLSCIAVSQLNFPCFRRAWIQL